MTTQSEEGMAVKIAGYFSREDPDAAIRREQEKATAEIARLTERHQVDLAQAKRDFERRLSAVLTEVVKAKADADRYWQAWQDVVNPGGQDESE